MSLSPVESTGSVSHSFPQKPSKKCLTIRITLIALGILQTLMGICFTAGFFANPFGQAGFLLVISGLFTFLVGVYLRPQKNEETHSFSLLENGPGSSIKKLQVTEDASAQLIEIPPFQDLLQKAEMHLKRGELESAELAIQFYSGNQVLKDDFLERLAKSFFSVNKEKVDLAIERIQNIEIKNNLLQEFAFFLFLHDRKYAFRLICRIKEEDRSRKESLFTQLANLQFDQNELEDAVKSIMQVFNFPIQERFLIKVARSYLKDGMLDRAYGVMINISMQNHEAQLLTVELAQAYFNQHNMQVVYQVLANLIKHEIIQNVGFVYGEDARKIFNQFCLSQAQLFYVELNLEESFSQNNFSIQDFASLQERARGAACIDADKNLNL